MLELEQLNVEEIINSVSMKLSSLKNENKIEDPALIGIRRGGVWIGKRISKRCFPGDRFGELNIAYYRDDFRRIGLHPTVEPSELPFDIEGRDMILFDDILHTGRTIRAAMNEIFDYGRPNSISLVVLLDRGGRELPISPNISGINMELSDKYHVKIEDNNSIEFKVFERLE